MGFVKTPEELARIETTLANPRFAAAQLLSVEFLTDPEFVAAVLPPPLEAVERPQMRAMVGRWESNCVGDFHGGTVYVAARHQGVAGEYQLSQFIDRDAPTIFGRDLFGEPKKRPAADGHGLQEDAILTLMRTEVRAGVSLTGAAAINLRGTVHDPLDRIPIDSLTRATYLEADLVASCKAVARTPATVFAPYHHGRNDDWSAHDTEGRADEPPDQEQHL